MSHHHCRAGMVLVGLVAWSSSAAACLWDYDTLKQERARFPGAIEIITGKFLRHSKEFYEWRIQDRLKRIAADPKNASLYDDLAVAYEKTGHTAQAIETMLQVEKFAPGRYETYSNLGTFYFLAGDFQKGLAFVDRVLAINPNAHFGREKYQKWLTEYVIKRDALKAKKADQERRKVADYPGRENEFRMPDFCTFLERKLHPDKEYLEKAEYQAAVKGVLGMMRFAYHDSLLLLDVLGNLLNANEDPSIDAKQLAARAFLQASYQAKEVREKDAYRAKAKQSLLRQTQPEETSGGLTLEELEKEFQTELADAAHWYADLRDKEIGWIRNGQNPEEEFDRLYTTEPRVPGEIGKDDTYPGNPAERRINALIRGIAVILAAGILSFVAIVLVWKRYRRSIRIPPNLPPAS